MLDPKSSPFSGFLLPQEWLDFDMMNVAMVNKNLRKVYEIYMRASGRLKGPESVFLPFLSFHRPSRGLPSQ